MKDSFVLYAGYLENIEILSMEQRGVLITALMKYVLDQDPPDMDGATKMAFSFICSQIDKDQRKYDEICIKRSKAGSMGGRPKKSDGFSEKQIEAKKANGFSEKQKNPDNEYEYEYDNDLKKKIQKKESAYTCAFEQFWNAYPRKKEKAKAYACYKARLADGFSEDELLLAVKRYADECRANRTEDRYIKLGSTFLSASTPFSDYLGDYKPPAKSARENKFNNFDGRDYEDMDDLTRRLIEGGQR